MTSRLFNRATAVLATLILIAGWTIYRQNANPSSSSRPPRSSFSGTIVIGTATWPGYFPLYVAKDKGYFKDEGVNVEVTHVSSLAEVSKNYVAGKMQGRANLTLDAVNESLQGLDHRIVLAVDYSSGADAILAGPQIQTVEDFRGKKVGYEPDTLEEFFLVWALNESGLSLADIESVSADPEQAARKLKSGEVDVAVTYEPFVSEFVASGDFHKVYSSADAPGLITDILTFRTDFVNEHPDAVHAVVRAYFRAIRLWKERPEEVYLIVAKAFGDTPQSIQKQLEGITILDERDNETAFTYSPGLTSLYGNLREIGKFVSHHKGVPFSKLDTDRLVEDRFIRQLIDETR